MDGIIVEKIPVNRFVRKKTGFWFGMHVWNSIAEKHDIKFEEFDKVPPDMLAIDTMYFAAEWYAWKNRKRSISYKQMKKSMDLMPAAQVKRIEGELLKSRVGGKSIMELRDSKKKQVQKS